MSGSDLSGAIRLSMSIAWGRKDQRKGKICEPIISSLATLYSFSRNTDDHHGSVGFCETWEVRVMDAVMMSIMMLTVTSST